MKRKEGRRGGTLSIAPAWAAAWVLFALGAVAMGGGGCSSPRIANTRLGSMDLVTMTGLMAESLVASPYLSEPASGGGATEGAGPVGWVVSMRPVSNQSNEIIPADERWAFLSRLRSLLTQSASLRERGVSFVLPAERADALNVRQHEPGGAVAERLQPTHTLASTFYSITTAGRAHRSDAYLCAFQLIDLRDDRVVWEDRYEVKRGVERNKFD